jgi:hypothetical protein
MPANLSARLKSVSATTPKKAVERDIGNMGNHERGAGRTGHPDG